MAAPLPHPAPHDEQQRGGTRRGRVDPGHRGSAMMTRTDSRKFDKTDELRFAKFPANLFRRLRHPNSKKRKVMIKNTRINRREFAALTGSSLLTLVVLPECAFAEGR